MTYTERAFNVSDEDEIKRIREYIAKLKAELARVRGLDPVEFWWDEIGRIQKKIDALLSYPANERPPAVTAQLATLEAELNTQLEERQALLDADPNADTSVQDAEIARLEAEIEVILDAVPPTAGLTEGQKDELTALYGELNDAILRYRIEREPKRTWHDITGDVVWSQTTFTQTAKTGPGSFQITLRGDHPEFRSGEEIHFEVDDLRSFGGWVTGVERGYFFEDAVEPRTILRGTDYNILFDRLVPRNYPWEYSASLTRGRMMLGPYRGWPDFPQGTLDSDMIDTVFGVYLLPDLPLAFDYTSGVSTIDTPAPVSAWTMPTVGSTLRNFMQSVSRITSGVWSIDSTMTLQYHDREKLFGPRMPDGTPIAITDGLGGISSSNLSFTTDISSMVNDVIVWGTLAKTVEGEIVYWHEQGDAGFWERYYLNLIKSNQKSLQKLLSIPLVKRTAKQKKTIIALREKIAANQAKLADVRARAWDPESGKPRPEDAIVNSIDTWGQWQLGEFREDLHQIGWITRRAHSILTRYDEPIITAKATIWDPNFHAGMVVPVKSSEHGIDTVLVIRQITISFSVPKEPHDGRFYAVPRYDLDMGLEPEAPWNIYDYLPFPGESTPGLGGDVS